MTLLHDHNLVTRETATVYRPLIVRLCPRYLQVREKARRDILEVDYAVLYEFALKMRWKREQAEKRERKLARSGKS